MARTPINSYGGFTGVNLQQIWQINRIEAQRYEIGNFYKPAMVRFNDGELLAAPFYYQVFGKNDVEEKVEEHLVFLSSTDDGATWKEVGKRMQGREARLQVLRDNTLIMTCFWCGNDVNNTSGETLYGLWRSYDRGRTWAGEWLDRRDIQPEAYQCIGSRNVLEMSDGSILFGVSSYALETFHGDNSDFVCKHWFFRSKDHGKTWCERVPVDIEYASQNPPNYAFFNEVDIHCCPSGRVIGISRFVSSYPKKGKTMKSGCEQGDNLRIFRLKEDAKTWVEERELLDYGQVHPHLLDLPGGRLLCCYTNRNFPFGAQAIVSEDEGRTWSEDKPYILAWFSWDSTCGFPNSVLLPDGSILTAYTYRKYRGLEKTEDEVYSEVVRWRVD